MPSLSVTALRLAAVETLAPWAAVEAGTGYPTLAGRRVFDSRAVSMEDMGDGSRAPAIGVYTEESRGDRRGEAAPSSPKDLTVDLVLELELAVVDEFDGEVTIGNPVSDPQAEAELDFMAAQVRRLLEREPGGALFRSICKAVQQVRVSPFRVTELGVRLSRRTMTLTCLIDDDEWSDEGGLPEPLKTLSAKLPDGSYGRMVLDRIAAAIAPTVRDPLDALRLGFGMGETAPETPEDGDIQGQAEV